MIVLNWNTEKSLFTRWVLIQLQYVLVWACPTSDTQLYCEFLRRFWVEVTLVGGLVLLSDVVEDEDPGVHVNVHADPTVGDEDLPINMFCESELREL